MKKNRFFSLFLVFFSFSFLFSQNFISVELSDKVYDLIEYGKIHGLCKNVTGFKPYTHSEIISCLNEMIENEDVFSENEIEILKSYKEKYEFNNSKKNNLLSARFENSFLDGKLTNRFLFDISLKSIASGGVYNNKDCNSFGMDNLIDFNVRGDFSTFLSYRVNPSFDVTKMPLQKIGEYEIGYMWYNRNSQTGELINQDGTLQSPRTINVFKNHSYLPYSYSKPWAGQMYFLSNMSASGLEGWPMEWGLSGFINGEIRFSFFDNNLKLGAGRFRREYAAMDNGSSLVLNSFAQPFFAADFETKIFKWLKFSSLAGILEYPNQDFVFERNVNGRTYNALPILEGNESDDQFFFQNGFSINMFELDFDYIHLDFGGSCIWPKRFEIGYLFPLACFVEYQNHIGDADNLGLFANFKFRMLGFYELWASVFVDEINGLNDNPFIATRDMFAYQAGIKFSLPFLSLSTISFRYTKIEPYCYTHHSINYTSWYAHYICENYSNNGESLGYYLPPNSDEFRLDFNWTPNAIFDLNANYQFIRHGADYGTQQVPGSSIYSELNNHGRTDLRKYFLHDGAYNWIHIVSVGGNANLRKFGLPIELFGNIGFMYSYYTIIDNENYTRDGKAEKCGFSTKYQTVNTTEYPTQTGIVLTFGVKFSL